MFAEKDGDERSSCFRCVEVELNGGRSPKLRLGAGGLHLALLGNAPPIPIGPKCINFSTLSNSRSTGPKTDYTVCLAFLSARR